MDKLIDTLKNAAGNGVTLLDIQFDKNEIYTPDLSLNNGDLLWINLDDPVEFGNWLIAEMKTNNAKIAIGGYGEDRMIYKRSKHFGIGSDARTIHLGVDLWAAEGTHVKAPFDAMVHSFQNNKNHGDYGGTIILAHEIDNQTFYTLYGHLSLASLQNKTEGMFIKKGESFAQLGNHKENGGWPPHLHFQIIRDMMGKKGDFYGVASLNDKEQMMHNCPNPNIILEI